MPEVQGWRQTESESRQTSDCQTLHFTGTTLASLPTFHFPCFNYIVLVWHSSEVRLGLGSLGLHSQLSLTYSFLTRRPSKTERICHLKWFGPQRS